MTEAAARPLPNLWDDSHAADLDEPGQLLYRSNLLGGDLRITNFGGGNTVGQGRDGRVRWTPKNPSPSPLVKGSGGDIGSMKRDGFSTLYLDKLESLKGLYRGLDHEDEMVALFNHCTFNLNPRATSIDTSLHAFVPHAHVDHVHADAVIAIAASANAEELTRKIFGGALGFLPWQRPGFDLGLKLGAMAAEHPEYVGYGARRARPASGLGRDLEILLRGRRCASFSKPPTGLPPTRSSHRSAARASRRPRPPSAAKSRPG